MASKQLNLSLIRPSEIVQVYLDYHMTVSKYINSQITGAHFQIGVFPGYFHSLLWETSDAEVVAVRNGEFYPGGFPICEEEG